MNQLTKSYAHGASATPLIGETIGAFFDQAAERWADREALVGFLPYKIVALRETHRQGADLRSFRIYRRRCVSASLNVDTQSLAICSIRLAQISESCSRP